MGGGWDILAGVAPLRTGSVWPVGYCGLGRAEGELIRRVGRLWECRLVWDPEGQGMRPVSLPLPR